MSDFVHHPLIQALAWALVHFLWQGAAIGLASFIVFRFVRTASVRYAIGVGALAAMVAAPVTTFLVLSNDAGTQVIAGSASAAVDTIAPAASAAASAVSVASAAIPLRIAPEVLFVAVVAWLGGVAFFGIRLMGGWLVARRLTRRAVQPASAHIQVVARQLADRLALNRAVIIFESTAVVVPMMVGWLKPAILLPAAALAGLSPSQMEALLAHELAHVRRHDYLVNLLQSVAEALLFYHPAVWWLGRRVRADRELCCDDLAVSVCDPLVYASALSDLAAMMSPGLALAATDGDLLARVRRILGQSDAAPAIRSGAMPLLALGLVACVAVPVALASSQAPVVVRPVEVVVEVKPDPLSPAVSPERPAVVRHADRQVVAPLEIEVTSEVPQQTAQQQADQQRAEEIKRQELIRRLEELKRTLAELEAQHVASARDLDTQKMNAAAQKTNAASQKANAASLKAREIEIDAAQRQLEEAKRKFDAGLISEAQLNDARAVLMKIQAAGDPVAHQKLEMQMALERLARSQQLVEKGLMSTQDLSARQEEFKRLAQVLNEMAVAQAASAQRLREVTAERQATTAERLHEAKTRLEREREVAPEGQPLAANEPVRAGDYLRINIDGESDLRTSYRVSDDGTIRMPLIGAIKVVGLTAAQVRDAIGKQLAAHKLKTVEQVKVTLTRVR